MKIDRRSFIVLGSAALGSWSLPAMMASSSPRLRFGVVSDVHIGGRKESPKRLKAALEYLSRQNVDAVLFPGDIAHTGQIRQIRQFADIWFSVFPNSKAKDGHKVEMMISTGNHDAWKTPLNNGMLFYGENAAKTWKEVLGLEWAPVWRKEVRGYTFFGSQWPTYKPDLAGFMGQYGSELKGEKPVFYCQHQAPLGTCVGDASTIKDDPVTKLFAAYSNIVAFSGHSHQTIADERTLWQGGFTSIGAGCLHEGGAYFKFENLGAFWHPSLKQHVMAPMNDPDVWGGDPDGGCFEMVDVFDNYLRIERRSSVYDLPIGPDLIVTIPSQGSIANSAAKLLPPSFPSEAQITVEFFEKGHKEEGVSFKNKPCYLITFPAAQQVSGGNRVFSYEVKAKGEGKEIVRNVIAPGFASPISRADRDGYCIFLKSEMPASKVCFEVTALDCFGHRSQTIIKNS